VNYADLVKTIDSASRQLLGRAAAVVNQALVVRNWLIGAYIVTFEQRASDRAKYGARLLERLCGDLAERGLPGLSLSMLERTRRFYFCYPQLGTAIPSSLLTELASTLNQSPLDIPSAVMTESSSKAGRTISAPPARKSDRRITPLSPNAVLHFSWTQLIEFIRLDDPLKRAFYENECLKGNWSVR